MSEKKKPVVKLEDLDQPAEGLTDEQSENAKGGTSFAVLLGGGGGTSESTRSASDAEPSHRTVR